MGSIVQIVEALFALRGFEAEPAPAGHVLLLRRGPERLAVRVREGREPLSAGVAREAADTLPALGHAVVVCAGEVGREAREILERAGIDAWTRDKLVHELGSSILEAAERGRLPALATPRAEPRAPADAPPGPAAPQPAPPPPRESSAADLWARPSPRAAAAGHLAVRAAEVEVPGEALAPGHEAAPAAQPTSPDRAGAPERVLAAAVGREEALRVGASRLLRVGRAALELVPLHAFRYRCKLRAPGAAEAARTGLLAVDAVTGSVRELAEPRFAPAGAPAERLRAALPEPEAAVLARRKVVELHSEKVRVRASLGNSALLVEDRWVRPEPASIELEHGGLWWLPVWRLEGQNGSLRLNAVSGEVEEEKLKRAYATDAEFL